MASWRERSGPPWYGVDEALLRRLEIHETRVHELGPVASWSTSATPSALFDPADPDPFFNRVGAIRWPDDPAAFGARLAELIRLFDDRGRAAVRLAGARLPPAAGPGRAAASAGFVELGGGPGR